MADGIEQGGQQQGSQQQGGQQQGSQQQGSQQQGSQQQGSQQQGSLLSGQTGGGQPGGWLDGVRDDLVTDKIRGFSGVEDLIESYRNMEQFVGKKEIALGPDGVSVDNLTDEQRAEIFRKLGAPEDPDGYEWEAPDGLDLDQDAHADFAQRMHEAGFTQEQYKAAMDMYADAVTQDAQAKAEQAQAQADEVVAMLKKDNPEGWDADLARGRKVINDLGLRERLEKDGLANHPAIWQMAKELAQATGESSLHEGAPTAAGAKAELETLKQSEAYQNPRHPGHQQAIQRRQQLYEAIYS